MPTKLNLHKLMSRDEGYLRKLRVAKEDEVTLSTAREQIRDVLRGAFRNWRTYLSESELRDNAVAAAFIPNALPTPKFRIQGSFAYFTVNDCQNPPRQQIDQDDGVFLPLSFVMVGNTERPTIASEAYFKLVERALAPLCSQKGWLLNFKKKKNSCVRVQLNGRLHIDLPLYAVRDNAFEALVETAGVTALQKSFLRDSRELDERIYRELSGAELILAHRELGWIQSDPRVLETWFKNANTLYGDIVRDLSRAFKGLRDAKFNDGLSSICIMALVVRAIEQLDGLNTNRFDVALVEVAREIARNLQQPVVNPAFPDDATKHLCVGWTPEYRATVRTLFADAADQLEEGIDGTFHRSIAMQKARAAYGQRVPNDESLISVDSVAAAVRSVEPQPQPRPVVPRTKSG